VSLVVEVEVAFIESLLVAQGLIVLEPPFSLVLGDLLAVVCTSFGLLPPSLLSLELISLSLVEIDICKLPILPLLMESLVLLLL